MFNKKDYMSSLNKARRKRNQNPYVTYLFYGLAGIAAVMVLVFQSGEQNGRSSRRKRMPLHRR